MCIRDRFIIDVYGQYAIVYEKGDSQAPQELKETHMLTVIEAIEAILPERKVVVKNREVKKGLDQYSKIEQRRQEIIVKEDGLNFIINPYDYLDVGLFLDHRPMRRKFKKVAQGTSFLNLFCYTCSASVCAANVGATTINVDKSNTYLEWAKRNFEANRLALTNHSFVKADVLSYLSECEQKFDMIFLDPPTFSNESKKDLVFEVERDQLQLISMAMSCLTDDGILYFSTNKRSFKMLPEIVESYDVQDITTKTIPMDYRDQKIHRCFEIRN